MILFLLTLLSSSLDIERTLCNCEHIRVSRELGELISLRAVLLRLATQAEVLQAEAGAPLDLIEAGQNGKKALAGPKRDADSSGGSSAGLTIHPLFYSQLEVGLTAHSLGDRHFELSLLWFDVSGASTEQTLKIGIDVQERWVGVNGTNRVEMRKTGMRIVLPTRVQLFVYWRCAGCAEVLIWNGCRRHRLRLEENGIESAPVIDTDVDLPAGFTKLKDVPTVLALCDGSVRDLRSWKPSQETLSPVDSLVCESFAEWGDDPTGARTQWQRRLLKALARLEAVDEEARGQSFGTQEHRLALAARRAAISTELGKEMESLDQAVTDAALRLARLRLRHDALKRAAATRVHSAWLEESGELQKLLETIRRPATPTKP